MTPRQTTTFATVRCAVCAVLAAAFLTDGAARAKVGDQAGVAAVVRGDVDQISYRTPKATVGRNVTSGDRIFLGDRIKTGGKSGLQIMLLDKTVFTIGPNSTMAIDEFVYDPKTKKGKVSARIVKGSFRFVSGAIARNNKKGMTIKLPVATIGVRGTTGGGSTDGRSAFIMLLGLGPKNSAGRPKSYLLITAGGVTQILYRAGFGVFIASPGAPPGRAQRMALRLRQWRQALFLPFLLHRRAALRDRNRTLGNVFALSGQSIARALRPLRNRRNAAGAQNVSDQGVLVSRNTALSTGRILFGPSATLLTGSGTGIGTFTLVLDLGSRSFAGFVGVTAGPGFAPMGNGQFVLQTNPYGSFTTGVNDGGAVSGLPGTVIVFYTIQNGRANFYIDYDDGIAASGSGSVRGRRIR